jgi:hypothetical protein
MSTTASEPAETGSQIDVAPPEPTPEDGAAGVSRTDAEKLDTRIRRMATSSRTQLDTLGDLVEQAKAGRIHETLGFPSWTAYLADALGELCSGEGIEIRRELVAYLYDAGMPQHAIAAATGVNQSTVSRDLESAARVMHDASPSIADEHGCPNRGGLHPPNPVAAELTVDDNQPNPSDTPAESEPADKTKAKVSIGRDGKSYPRQRKKPAAKPKPKPKGQGLDRQPVDQRPVSAENHIEVLGAMTMGLREIFAEAADAIPGELDESVTPQIAAELLDQFRDARKVFTPVYLRLQDRRAGTTETC